MASLTHAEQLDVRPKCSSGSSTFSVSVGEHEPCQLYRTWWVGRLFFSKTAVCLHFGVSCYLSTARVNLTVVDQWVSTLFRALFTKKHTFDRPILYCYKVAQNTEIEKKQPNVNR